MIDKEFKKIEKEINIALANFSMQDSITEERIFRKEFHTKFFEKLKEGWNQNSKINTEIIIKYGLIHNSIHTKMGEKSCEIGDFLFVVKNSENNINNLAKSLLLQVKATENRDDNFCQKNLYAKWSDFTFTRPKNAMFLNDSSIPLEINVSKKISQSVYFEYSKSNIKSANKYLIKEIKSNENKEKDTFELYNTKYFSNFLLNLFFNNEGRTFFYSEDFDLSYRKFYRRKNYLNDILHNYTCGIQFSDDWDFIINSIINYSNNKKSSNAERQKNTSLNFITLTDNPKIIEDASEDDNCLRIVEIEIKRKYVG